MFKESAILLSVLDFKTAVRRLDNGAPKGLGAPCPSLTPQPQKSRETAIFVGSRTGKIGQKRVGMDILGCPTELLRDAPLGSYLLEQKEGAVLLLRLSEGEPNGEAYVPLSLWPLLLPP
jgi:hypothetical protein